MLNKTHSQVYEQAKVLVVHPRYYEYHVMCSMNAIARRQLHFVTGGDYERSKFLTSHPPNRRKIGVSSFSMSDIDTKMFWENLHRQKFIILL